MLILSSIFAGYFLILIALYFLQDKLLFFPSSTRFGDCPEMTRYSGKANNFGGIRYYLKAVSNPDSWIVIFHGNAGNACDRIYFFDLLQDQNANLVIFEYPGYGKDATAPGEKIFLNQGVELISHIKETDPKSLPIYLMGESLGTGVATWISTSTDIKGLILISPYTSIAKVAQHHYFWLPVKFLIKNRFQADQWAKQTQTPAILFHGTNDDIIPISFARKQILNFKGEKELVEIPGCGHNDITIIGEQLIKEKISNFVSSRQVRNEESF